MKKIHLCLISFLILLISCNQKPSNVSAVDQMKYDLENVIKTNHANTKFSLKTIQDERSQLVVMRNASVGKQIDLGKDDSTILLGYYAESLKNAPAKVFKTELVKKGKRLFLQTTDEEGKLVEKKDFPIMDADSAMNDSGGFETLDDCIESFFCTFEGIQCEANKTCETQFYGTTCCLNDGSCFSIHFIFPPTNPWCRFKSFVFDTPLVVARY